MTDGILEIGPGHFVDLDRIMALGKGTGCLWWLTYVGTAEKVCIQREEYKPLADVIAAWKARKRQKARIELASRSLIAGCSMAKALEEADALLEAAQE